MMAVSEINVNGFAMSALEVGTGYLRLYHLQLKEVRNFPGLLKLAFELPKLNKWYQAFKNADKLIPVSSEWICRCITCLNTSYFYLKVYM